MPRPGTTTTSATGGRSLAGRVRNTVRALVLALRLGGWRALLPGGGARGAPRASAPEGGGWAAARVLPPLPGARLRAVVLGGAVVGLATAADADPAGGPWEVARLPPGGGDDDPTTPGSSAAAAAAAAARTTLERLRCRRRLTPGDLGLSRGLVLRDRTTGVHRLVRAGDDLLPLLGAA